MLKENYELVDQKITEACKRAGRDRKDVTLIAVSKTKPLSDIEELLAETDAIDFGENKVQELVDKYETVFSACSFVAIPKVKGKNEAAENNPDISFLSKS